MLVASYHLICQFARDNIHGGVKERVEELLGILISAMLYWNSNFAVAQLLVEFD